MFPFQRSFSPVCGHESGDGGDGGVECETGQNSKPCKNNLGKRMLNGMKSLLKRRQAIAAATSSTPVDAWPKRAGDSVGSEADDLDLGNVLQTLRVLLSASDVDLALCFIDNLSACGLFRAKVSWKREAYGNRVTEFVRSRNKEMSAEVAFELLSITDPTQFGGRASPKGLARATSSSEPVVLPPMQLQRNSFSRSCSLGKAESVCTNGEQVPEELSSERSRTKRSPSLESSAVSQGASEGAPRGSVSEKTDPVRLRWKTRNSSTSSSTSEVIAPQACPDAVRRGPLRNSTDVNRATPRRNSHNRKRRTPSPPAQRQEGVCSRQLSAEQHPDFNHFLAAELQQYHMDRVLRLGRSFGSSERQHNA